MNPTRVAGASASANTYMAQARPWYREPWVWVLIAFPVASVVGCAITIWLALSHPDYLVVDEQEYQQIETGLEAGTEASNASASDVPAEVAPTTDSSPASASPAGVKLVPEDGNG